MATFVYFMEDPTNNAVDAPDILTGAQKAAQEWADSQPQMEGTSTFPIWAVDVSAIGYGECKVTVTVNREVTVTPQPRPT